MDGQVSTHWPLWMQAGLLFVLAVLLVAALFSLALRRYFRPAAAPAQDATTPRADNPQAFMSASVQAVIQRLREQEKELERLHRLERERADHTERLSEAVTRHMPAGLLLVNAAGLITSANPAAEQILGVRALHYRRYSEVFRPQSSLTRMVATCLGEGFTFRREEVDYVTPGGVPRNLGVTISPVVSAASGPSSPSHHTRGAVILLSDLTELTALQRQIRLKENLAALGEMAAGIAHEVKNALATISGYAQMVRDEAESRETTDHAEQILRETRTLAHLVTEFLRYARPLEMERQPVPLGAMVARVVSEIAERLPQVEVTTEGRFNEVCGDEALLRQALLNLLRNAAEAVAGQPDARVVVRGTLTTRGSRVLQQITVADNGPGIVNEDLPKIFLPFFTTKPQGTGLGLAVVQKIALQHGGGVEARNRADGGAEFTLWLPAQQEQGAQAPEAAGNQHLTSQEAVSREAS